MRAVRVVDGRADVVEAPRPTGDGVVVDVRAAGICGSDLHMIELGFTGDRTIGHEIAGVAPDGTRVAIEPLVPCGHCALCREGSYHLCGEVGASLYGLTADGGMADQIVVPARALVPLPDDLDLADASLVEPMAVAVHGLGLAAATAEDRVAVVGAGSIGLCAAAATVARGATVDVSARHDHQRAAAQQLGAGTETSGSYDLVIETAGTEDAMRRAARLAGPKGRVLMLSVHWQPITSPGMSMWTKEVTVLHSFTYCGRGPRRDIDVAAEILAATPSIGDALITHRFPLDDAAAAFDTAADRAAGAIKVVLEP
jgi:threonine dehydrogenase-like Zn-dependent dehydrogenase